MEHLGSIIWLIVIIIGGISSIVSASRRKSQSAQPAAPQRPASLPVRLSHQSQSPIAVLEPPPAAVYVAQATSYSPVTVRIAEEPPAPLPQMPPPEMPATAVPATPTMPAADLPQRRRGQIALKFEERGTWVRALIAAEVLGPPVSLREQRFWSQPHSERSI